MLWARLTWQAADPPAFAAGLGSRLGLTPTAGGLVPGAWLLSLGTAVLEVRPWIREGPMDHPRPAGRLVLEPVPDGEPAPTPTDDDPVVLVGLGWATVELERAATELGPWLGDAAPGKASRVEPHLGARAIVHSGAGLPGTWTVLLEPATEGPTAASLARDGEGPCALYVRPATGLAAVRGAGGPVRDGPFGRQLLLPGEFTGPFRVVTEGRPPDE